MPSSSVSAHPLSAHGLSFRWPDGTLTFDGLDLLVPPGRSGLVGVNGAGKSTLLRLLAGELTPTAGHVRSAGQLGYLRQDLTLDQHRKVADFLGIAETLAALHRIEHGSTDQRDFDTVGADWDIEERAVATLGRLGLPVDAVGRTLGQLSGGEVVQLGLARLLIAGTDVLLLDEPTNNLDADARNRLYDVVAGFGGTLLVVSHDRELLERVDRIGDLRDGRVRWYGGGFSAYADQVAAEQEAAEQAVTSAKAEVRRQNADRVEAEQTLARRVRYGKKMCATKREPRAVMKQRKRSQQESSAKYRAVHEERLEAARDRLTAAESLVREDREIRVDLPDTVVHRGTVVLRTRGLVLRHGLAIDLDLHGPERVALVGPNGSGKTTVLHTIAGRLEAESGTVEAPVPIGLLPQRLDLLDDGETVYTNVRRQAPHADAHRIRSQLARFLFRGRTADAYAATLSGGERFRASLACVLLAEPAPRLLLLDEPTNNLDFASYAALTSALASYRGALLVASHDEGFLDDVGIDRIIPVADPS